MIQELGHDLVVFLMRVARTTATLDQAHSFHERQAFGPVLLS